MCTFCLIAFPSILYTSAQLVDIVSSTGLSLDPVYTLKGVRGLLAEMGKNPGRFAGKRVLYIHTGILMSYLDVIIINSVMLTSGLDYS